MSGLGGFGRTDLRNNFASISNQDRLALAYVAHVFAKRILQLTQTDGFHTNNVASCSYIVNIANSGKSGRGGGITQAMILGQLGFVHQHDRDVVHDGVNAAAGAAAQAVFLFRQLYRLLIERTHQNIEQFLRDWHGNYCKRRHAPARR